jgi:hypothetical protein
MRSAPSLGELPPIVPKLLLLLLLLLLLFKFIVYMQHYRLVPIKYLVAVILVPVFDSAFDVRNGSTYIVTLPSCIVFLFEPWARATLEVI